MSEQVILISEIPDVRRDRQNVEHHNLFPLKSKWLNVSYFVKYKCAQMIHLKVVESAFIIIEHPRLIQYEFHFCVGCSF